MLTLLLGTDWISNREYILNMIASDVRAERGNRILLVPEIITHDTERRLCAAAGDTASRFAEVLSFTQLCRRVSEAVGHGIQPCLDNGGRLVAMAAAARQLHSKLKAYASVETRPVFLEGLVTAVDEFKRCCVTGDDLIVASKQSEGVLAQKLEELALLMQTYDALCENGLRDPSSQMTWLLEQLEDSTYAYEHTFYIDGFPDFTRQHLLIVENLISSGTQVVIGLNCDSIDSVNPAFEKAGETAAAILRMAKDNGIPVDIIKVNPRKDALQSVRSRIFRGNVQTTPELQDRLFIQQFDSVYDECLAAAAVIMNGMLIGDRYRDFAVVCTDVLLYKDTVDQVFARCGIPVYRSGTDDILELPVVSAILSAMDAALNGFEQRDVIRYVKSVLSPLDQETCDCIENYCVLWSIDGYRWKETWTNHPGGLDAEWDESSVSALKTLNTARASIIDPLINLQTAFREAVDVSQQVDGLFAFFDEICLSNKFERLADILENRGESRESQILEQLWEILYAALEQMRDVLGRTTWNQEAFGRLFRMLLSQYDVGTIPHVLDSVIMGPVNAMRCQQTKHLIVLGALEGQLPGYSGSTGVLSDHERVELRRLGVPLTGGDMQGVQAELAEIYGVFCGAEATIHVFCPSGQPSYVYNRLANMICGSSSVDVSMVTPMADPMEAGAYLLRKGDDKTAKILGVEEFYEQIAKKTSHELGAVSRENIERMYGKCLYLSASQVDKQANCRLSYFLRYGLNAKERKAIAIDPAEFGTYVHAVLEHTAKEIMNLGGFRSVTLEKAKEIAQRYSEEYAKMRFNQLDSERVRYLFNRNAEELYQVVQELWEEMQKSEFVPIGFEVAFGDGGDLQSIPISGQTIDARLRGFVDRVDAWNNNGVTYYRVVDYKTGRKDFDYCDILNGYGLQMLLYLFALENSGQLLLGTNPIPAGVQYFPARMPLISVDGQLSSEEIEAVRMKSQKRKGLLLQDEEVLQAMEPGEKPVRLSYTRKKDGTISGDVATREQLRLLKEYVSVLLAKMVDDIATGCVDPNPYTRGANNSACMYCPYAAVCHPAYVQGRRNFKSITAQRFWEDIQKELKKHGE